MSVLVQNLINEFVYSPLESIVYLLLAGLALATIIFLIVSVIWMILMF